VEVGVKRLADQLAAIIEYFAEHGDDAKANDVYRHLQDRRLSGRRGDALRLIALVRAARIVPSAGDGSRDAGTSTHYGAAACPCCGARLEVDIALRRSS
jgi:hypothetical protein